MTPAGILRYEQGLKKKPHDHGLPKRPYMPIELKKALSENKEAQKNFTTFPPSTKFMLYRWILRAKQNETKTKRIESIIKQALENNKNLR